MIGAVKIQVKPEEIIEAVKGMEKRKRDAFLEDLLASDISGIPQRDSGGTG